MVILFLLTFGVFLVLMSNPLPSAEAIVNEFAHAIDDIRDFTFASKKRALNGTQLKVLLKNKINRIKSAYNALISQSQIESAISSQLLFDSIPKLTDACNNISHDGVFELIWLELNAIINSLAASLITIHSKNDIWSVQGSATLLVQIISGIPKVNQLPSLVGRSIDDPEYLDHWRVTFNYLQFTAATYFGVIYAVKTVNLSDLISWTNQGFYYFSLLDNYFQSFEWEKMAQLQKYQANFFFNSVFTITSTFQNFVEYIVVVLKRLGTNWPSSIETQGFITDHSIKSLLIFLKHLKNHTLTSLQKLNDLYAQGMWTANDNPSQSDPYKQLLELVTVYDYYLSFFDALMVAHPSSPQFEPASVNRIEKLTKALELNQWFLSNTEDHVGDLDNLLNSNLGTQYVDTIEQRLELLTLNCLAADNTFFFESEITKLSRIFEKSDPLQYSSMILRKLFVNLFITSKFGPNSNFDELYSEIIRLKELLQFRPRDLTALIVLEIILGNFLKKNEIPTKDQIFISINKNGLINGGDYHLFTEFQEYIDYLLPALKGETSIISELLLTRKTTINIFDSTSWLIPDFNLAFKDLIKIPIFYLPFNRDADGIIMKTK